MAKKKSTDDTIETDEEKVNQPANAPVVPDSLAPAPQAVLAHQWQENSPALNTNTIAYHIDKGPNLAQELDPEFQEAKLKADEERLEDDDFKGLTDGEVKDRTKLDVSDPRYINPSLGHHKKKGK